MKKRVDLLNGGIASALTKLALPLMGMSLIQMAYNLTDMIWIGKLGAGPVAAIGTAGMFVWLSMGANTLAQIGGQIRVGQNLGAQKNELAGEYAKASIHMSAIIAFILSLILVFGATPLIGFFNLTSSETIAQAEAYLRIVGVGIIFTNISKVLISIITTTGNSHTPFIATVIGLVVNIILDPLLIFGAFFIPAMGVIGAGLATVFAQAIVLAMLTIHAMKDKHLFNHVKLFTLSKISCIVDILKLSFPTTMQNILFPIISIVLSRFVASFGDEAIAVQRVGSQIESISWMTAEGFSIAVNSFVSQNFGAGNPRRAVKGYYSALTIASIWGVFATCLLIFAASPIFSVFISEPKVLAMGVDYLVILGVSQLFMSVEIITTGSFAGFGKTKLPAIFNIVFTSIRIPLAFVLAATFLGLNGIWWSISISSILKGICLSVAFFIFNRKTRQYWPD